MDYEVFAIDATETPIERPITKNKKQTKRLKKRNKRLKKKKLNKQKQYYSGTKKRHTIKTQIVIIYKKQNKEK